MAEVTIEPDLVSDQESQDISISLTLLAELLAARAELRQLKRTLASATCDRPHSVPVTKHTTLGELIDAYPSLFEVAEIGEC